MWEGILVSCTITRDSPSCPTVTVSLCGVGTSRSQAVMLDSGSDANFMDYGLTGPLGVQLTLLPVPLKTTSLDGSSLCEVTHKTLPVKMSFNHRHTENISFLSAPRPSKPLFWGFPGFNKTKTSSSLPHRSYDCAIVLLPGAFPPRGRLYSFSSPSWILGMPGAR